MTDAPIGIFDSGIGGLTVARAIHELLPNEATVYLGDTARVPYGPKSPDTVRRYSLEVLEWLLAQNVKAVVVACNTATAHALDTLRAASPVPVLGVIEPGARAAVAASPSGVIGVIGTAGTIGSGAYRRALESLRPGVRIVDRACPLFVPLVEEGWFEHAATRAVAEEYLAPLRDQAVDVMVLGCTHYPLLKSLINDVMPGVRLIDSAEETARELAGVIRSRGIGATGHRTPLRRFAVTDDVERFRNVAAVFVGQAPDDVEHVELGAVRELS